jgi:hypothetical protein
MLYNARRIVFEPEFRLPVFDLDTMYKQPKEDLLNNKGQFFVHVDEKYPYVKELVRQAQNLGLTVSGDCTAPTKGGDITHVQKGDMITVGSSTRFDVNWIRRDQYFAQKGYRPVYDIVDDWNKIEKALKQFAAEKNSIKITEGTCPRCHARFAMVEGKAFTYGANKIAVLEPVKAYRPTFIESDIIYVKVVRY